MPRRGENIRKRKDGRWEGRFIRGRSDMGKALYSSVYGKTYAEVKRKLIMAQSSADKPMESKKPSTCFGELMFAWLDERKPSLRPQTYTRYIQLIERHLNESLGLQSVDKLRAKSINVFLIQKQNDGRVDRQGGLSASSVRLMAYIITATLEYAALQGMSINLNGSIHKPAQTKFVRQALTCREQMQLESFLVRELDQTKLGVLLSLRMGLRIGEICGLRWEDVDMQERLLFVRQSVQRITNHQIVEAGTKTVLVAGMLKTANACRVIPIPTDIANILTAYKDPYAAGYVFHSGQHGFLDPRTCQTRFHRYLQQSGLRDMNFHMLRHTFATRCVESGMDVKTLSELLGHANVSTTLGVYVHSSLDQKRTQLERVSTIRGQ